MLKSQSRPYFTIAGISLMRGIQTKIFRVGGEAADRVTRLGDFLQFGQLFKAFGNN